MTQWLKNLPTNAGDEGSIPGLRRSTGEGNGNPLQYSCLGNPMDRGACQAWVRHDWETKHKSPTHFDLFFPTCGVSMCSNCSNLHMAVQLSQYHLLRRFLFFLHCIFLPPLSKINWPYVCVLLSWVSLLFHWSVRVFLYQYHTALLTVAL